MWKPFTKTVEVERIVEVEVFVDRIVEKIVEIEVEKIVKVEVDLDEEKQQMRDALDRINAQESEDTVLLKPLGTAQRLRQLRRRRDKVEFLIAEARQALGR